MTELVRDVYTRHKITDRLCYICISLRAPLDLFTILQIMLSYNLHYLLSLTLITFLTTLISTDIRMRHGGYTRLKTPIRDVYLQGGEAVHRHIGVAGVSYVVQTLLPGPALLSEIG